MHRELKRISVVVLAMFLALFISTTVIQGVQAETLQADDRNVRTLYDSFSVERGPILIAGSAIATSTPVDSIYRFQREYVDGPMYAPLTGYFTLNQGITGLESALGGFLSGREDSQFFDQLMAIITGQSAAGAAAELTIDPEVQQAAWDALGDRRGAVVAYDPTTGRILAMVSKPSFDPNRMSSHSTTEVRNYYRDLLADPDKPLDNRAIAGALYHPGSTFKLLVAAAALENGYTPESTFDNPARLPLPLSTATISNAGNNRCGGGSAGDEVTLADALRLSCNIPIAELGMQLGPETLAQYAELFGFGRSVEVPLKATASIFPQDMDLAQAAMAAIGQFDVRATPLQIMMLSGAIANGGESMVPNLVERIISANFTELETFEPHVFSRPISEETAEILTEMMVANVSRGVAGNARIEGVSVAGKTGTAQNGDGQPYTYWFTGFAPAQNPEIAVAVVVEGNRGQSSSGNAAAAPIAKKVMEAVLKR